MPVWNAEKYLAESIESILGQTFRDFELIVVDDGSTDRSVEIIRSYRDDRIILRENPHDYIRSLNTGIALSRGKYIARMDADDIMLPNRLEVQFRYMEENPRTDVCGSWMEIFGIATGTATMPVRDEDIRPELLFGNCMCHPTIIMRRDSVARMPSFPDLYEEEFIYAEDCRLWTKLAMAGMRFANIPEVLVKYRRSKEQSTARVGSRMIDTANRARAEYLKFMAGKSGMRPPSFDGAYRSILYDMYRNRLRKMRREGKTGVLFCINTMNGGGAEKLLIDILKRFDYGKYCVDLLVLNPSGVYFKDIPAEVYWFTPRNAEYLNDTVYDIEIAFLEGPSLRYTARRESNARKVAWVHMDLFDFHWTRQYYTDDGEEEASYSRMDKIVFVSEDARTGFNRLFPKTGAAQEVIHNLIDADDIRNRADAFPVEKTKTTICCTGRLALQKGQSKLIPVVDRLINDDGLDVELWLIGDGAQREEVETAIRRYSLEAAVLLKGFHKNPYPFVKASDIVVSASDCEGYPLVLCEALCLGKAIVATNVSGTKEVLGDGEYGMLVENDEESIYRGLKQMIADKALREQYSRKALVRAGMFDAGKTMELICDTLSGGGL
jgi:glycosyltransferase involved in cell wall biosynthesis